MAISNSVLGLVALVVPLLLIGAIILRKLPWILALFVVALAVGSGYLHQTGALREVGQKVRPMIPAGFIKEHNAEPAATPAAATPPAEEPAMKPAEAPPADGGAMKPAEPPADGGAMKPAELPAAAPAAPAPAPSPSPAPANP